MNKTTIEYLENLMKESGDMIFFTITDSSDNLVYDQQNENLTLPQALDCLKNFFKFNEGIFNVKLRNRRIVSGKGFREFGAFTIVNTPEYKTKINGISETPENNYSASFGSSSDIQSLIAQLQKKDERIQELIHSNFMQLMAERDKLTNMQMEMLRKEMANPNQAFDAAALQAVTGMFGGGSPAINGLGDPVISNPTDSTQRLNTAIRTLIKIDPNFVSNIEKLAKLATNNKAMYNMAIQQLNNL